MLISKEIEIDMGHAVTHHNSKCKHLHGHRYLVRAWVNGEVIQTPESEKESSYGMVIDFSDLKKALMDVIDAPFDHAFVLWENDPRASLIEEAHTSWHNDASKFHLVPYVPTAENLAAHWFLILDPVLHAHNIELDHLEVFETPTSCVRCDWGDAKKFRETLSDEEFYKGLFND